VIAFPARAWWGDVLLASSTGARRADGPGGPELWFPWEDVRTDRLVAGAGGRGTYDAPGPWPAAAVRWGADPASVRTDGIGLVRPAAEPGYAVFDHDRARVEVVEEGDVATRFPYWGDATDLYAVLRDGAVVHDTRRPVVEGSQLLGQSIVAAMRRCEGRRVVSAHLAFVRAADANRPVAIELDPVSEGRSFSCLSARAVQDGRARAAGTLLLGVPSAVDVVAHGPSLDGVPGPAHAVPYDMGVTGRELRVVDAAYTDDPDAPVGPPSIDAWVRFRSVPDDPALHAGLLAQFTGHMSIAAALRPHAGVGQREAHRTLSTAINAIAISFHADVRMDRWVLYRHLATVVAGGMAHSECRAFTEEGGLVASFTVDAMIRPLDLPTPDPRSAL
jgi:acyl-CoA thioesterase